MLNRENYSKGLLIDDECMGGVSEHPERPDLYIAYVMNHQTAEYLNYGEFRSLDQALHALNSVPRPWQFEKAGGCGGCKGEGKCKGGGCGLGKKASSESNQPASSCASGSCNQDAP